MELDRDLQSIQEVRDLVKKARAAQKIMERMTQEELDRIVGAVACAAAGEARRLGELAAEETGFGLAADKEIKNRFAAVTLYEAIKDQKTRGILAEDQEKRVVDMGVPVGVVAALVPSTNPTSTVIYKALICLKGGNPVVFSPHPSALKCILAAVEVVSRAAREAGAPEGAVGCVTRPTMEATRALMSHRDTRLILATGGGGMVKAAYSSGTPAIGVGAGNGPALIHHSADVDLAVKRILDSKTFDNGTICASEQSIVIPKALEDKVLRALAAQGGYVLSQSQRDKLAAFILREGGTMNPAIVGKPVSALVKLAGLEGVPGDARVLIARETGVGPGYPYSSEKLGLILALYVEENEEAALERCVELLEWEGAGHTFSIHAQDEALVKKWAAAAPASRVLVNTASSLGGIGATTCLFPALTLGCGAVGGSSSSNNIGPLDLINIKRVAWGTKEVEELRGGNAAGGAKAAFSPGSQEEEALRRLIGRMLKELV